MYICLYETEQDGTVLISRKEENKIAPSCLIMQGKHISHNEDPRTKKTDPKGINLIQKSLKR